jgi:hypothetical protein
MASWGEQFSAGDQFGGKEEFWRSGFRVCPKCKSKEIKNEVHCAGCRHNGDGYGTEVYKCQSCDWTTSFQYDEAGECFLFYVFYMFAGINIHVLFLIVHVFVAEHYFYETAAFQRRAEEAAKPIVYVDFTPAMAAKYMKVRKVVPESSVRDNMRVDCIRQEDIDRFFSENPMESLPPLTCNPSAALKPVAGTGTSTDTARQDPTRRKSL